jgi:hypothetical protein
MAGGNKVVLRQINTAEYRNLGNEELNGLYMSVFNRSETARCVGCKEQMRNTYNCGWESH